MTSPNPQVTRLLFVRHGESMATLKEIVGGPKGCSGLTALGRQQSQRLAERIQAGHEPGIDAVLSSNLPRAVETAELAFGSLGLPLIVDGDLEEHRPGEADGVPWAEVTTRFGAYDPEHQPYARMAPGAETLAEFHHRVNAAVHRLIDTHAGKTVALVCHGGVIDMAFRGMLHLPYRPRYDLWTINASITEFEASHPQGAPPRRWRLRRYNDSAHLAGLPPRTET